MFSTICLKIAHYLSRNTKEEDQEEVIAFGLELIFSELSKLIILLAAGHILNILIEVIVITLVFSIYRMLSGGIHLDTFLACLLVVIFYIYLKRQESSGNRKLLIFSETGEVVSFNQKFHNSVFYNKL